MSEIAPPCATYATHFLQAKSAFSGDECWQHGDLKALIPLKDYEQCWSVGLRCTISGRASDGRVEQCGVAAGLACQWG
jgi:hypothetical protein